MLIVHAAQPLFAWDELEDSPSLNTIRELLAALPDAKLLESLRAARGKGRDDYPVGVLWGVLVLRVALRHATTEAALAELRRNEALRRLVGIESERRVPKSWNVSRFEDALGREPHRSLLKEVFRELVRRLGAAVVDLGADAASGSVTTYAHDAASELTGLIDPDGNATSWGYDSAGRETTETDPLSKTTTYAYDYMRELTQKTDRDNRVTQYAYDADGRETAETWVGSSPAATVTMTYDAARRMTQAQEAHSKYEYNQG